jgi:hypothetical protein
MHRKSTATSYFISITELLLTFFLLSSAAVASAFTLTMGKFVVPSIYCEVWSESIAALMIRAGDIHMPCNLIFLCTRYQGY